MRRDRIALHWDEVERLGRGEVVQGGPGACLDCGHAKVWHRPRTQLHPCEKCDCTVYLDRPEMSSRRYHSTDEYVASVARMIRAAGRRVGGEDPEQLAALADLRTVVDDALLDAVRGQRAAGVQWASMGDALGVTKQAVIQRWASQVLAGGNTEKEAS